MDISQVRQLKPRLRKFLKRFDDCFPRKDTRAHLPTYISGQLSQIPEKSVEPIALKAGVAPRTLQEFLSQHHWDHDLLRDQLQHIVRDEHAGPHSIGVIDETSDIKKGDKTPGVQRQWCGSRGKKENCLVTVHLGYARDGFHGLIDGELYLPESWSADRPRCREAGIPDEMTYRPKWVIALELYDQALANGLRFDWVTFDEGYGSKPDFLRGLGSRQQVFVGEVPCSFTGWLKPGPKGPPAGRRRQAGAPGRGVAGGARLPGSVVATLAGEGWEERPDDLGGQARPVHPQGRGRDAGRSDAPGGGPERPGPQGGGEVLREQRPPGDTGREIVAGGVLALEGRALFRGPEIGDWVGSVRRSSLPGVETPPDPELRELPVPDANAGGVRGGKSRS
jgi:hypothetical protein